MFFIVCCCVVFIVVRNIMTRKRERSTSPELPTCAVCMVTVFTPECPAHDLAPFGCVCSQQLICSHCVALLKDSKCPLCRQFIGDYVTDYIIPPLTRGSDFPYFTGDAVIPFRELFWFEHLPELLTLSISRTGPFIRPPRLSDEQERLMRSLADRFNQHELHETIVSTLRHLIPFSRHRWIQLASEFEEYYPFLPRQPDQYGRDRVELCFRYLIYETAQHLTPQNRHHFTWLGIEP
jgi:hypothetical protein